MTTHHEGNPLPSGERIAERLERKLCLWLLHAFAVHPFASKCNLVLCKEPAWVIRIRASWENRESKNGNWQSDTSAHDE